jgi:hypothetical protein
VCVRQAPDVGSADQVGRHMHAVLMGLGGHVAFIGVCVCVCVCVGGGGGARAIIWCVRIQVARAGARADGTMQEQVRGLELLKGAGLQEPA